MLEHLDDPLQPFHSFADPTFDDVHLRALQRRRTQSAIAGVVVFSVLVTGGVSGLALGGPEVVHAPIGAGPLLVIGAPRSSSAGVAPVTLTASERTSPDACASLAEDGRPTSSAAVAVAVTDAVVLPTVAENGSPGATPSRASSGGSSPVDGLRSSIGGPGSSPISHPVAGRAPGGAPSGGGASGGGGTVGGGGVQVPPPTTPPVLDPPPTVDPPVDPPVVVDPTGDPGGDPSGDPSQPAGPVDDTPAPSLPLIGDLTVGTP